MDCTIQRTTLVVEKLWQIWCFTTKPPKFHQPTIIFISADLLCKVAIPPLIFCLPKYFGWQSAKVFYHQTFVVCGSYYFAALQYLLIHLLMAICQTSYLFCVLCIKACHLWQLQVRIMFCFECSHVALICVGKFHCIAIVPFSFYWWISHILYHINLVFLC